MGNYKTYTAGTYKDSDELTRAKQQQNYWNGQNLVDFTFGEQDLGQDYHDVNNALKNLVNPTWNGFSKQQNWDNNTYELENMKDFSYDVNGDALYQQYKDQYVNQGKMAMMDTMGQAAAMTGGYGNSYAQSVGQQAYQGHLQQLTDKIPELYKLALSKYNSDRDNLYKMNDLYQNLYNNVYRKYRDDVSDYHSDRTYLSGRESDLYDRYYTKKYDTISSHNKNITDNRTNINGLVNDLSTLEWNQHTGNEALKQAAIQIENDNAERQDKYDFEALEQKYSDYIKPDDIEVDENGNIVSVDGYTIAGADGGTTSNAYLVSENTVTGFSAKNGDNFKVKVGDKTYKVENKGKVDDTEIINRLNRVSATNNQIINLDGNLYIKHSGGYYEIGATNGLFNIGETKGYSNLLGVLN